MKKKNKNINDDDMLPEYDFKGKKGVRRKYAKALKQGYSIRVTNEDGTVTVKQFILRDDAVVLDPDVKVYFPDSESVHHALCSLIELIPQRSEKQVAERKKRYKVK